MYEYVCQTCGKTVSVERSWQVRAYCSVSCGAKASAAKRREIDSKCIDGECIYQPESIDCYKRNCSKCGWNPEVAQARLERYGVPKEAPAPEIKVYFGEWISVGNRLPKDREQVLAYTQTGKVMSLHCKDGKWCTSPNIEVSHWMPMPEGPQCL